MRKICYVALIGALSAVICVGCKNIKQTNSGSDVTTTVGTRFSKDNTELNKNKTEFSIENANVKIPNYKGIILDCTKKRIVTEDEVKDALTKFLANYDLYTKDMKSIIKEGDTVNIDFTGKINGKEFEGGSAENYDIEIGSGSFISGFEEQLVGHKATETINVNVTFPNDYFESSLQGKSAVFVTTINYKKVPVEIPEELTDSFIQQHTTFSTVEKYREYVIESLNDTAEDELKNNKESAVTKFLMENSVFKKLPKNRIEKEISNNDAYYKDYAKQSGITFNEMIKKLGYEDEDAYKKALKDYSTDSVKYYLICREIADEEHLNPIEEEYQKEGTALAKEYGYKDLLTFEEAYDRERIEETIINKRVIDFVIKNVEFNYTEPE